ncbi:MAG: sugar ABC transporter ATP-binding protein [Actinomycetaceae bacterium]|nr:sugar ABC transporter ATP-binding protein [Actinomycetaceae bacterium]
MTQVSTGATTALAEPTADIAIGEVIMSARNVSKVYGGTHALRNVDFDIYKGEVTVLLGENGAGKSTLMKIMSGVERPTAGSLQLKGQEIAFSSPTDAVSQGVAIIHQEMNLCLNMTIAQNIFLAREVTRGGVVNKREQNKRAALALSRLEEDIRPDTLVGDLRLGQQQLVEIARALEENAEILIMDEPTSALSVGEVKVLFKVIRDLTAHGVSVVYISHHLDECLEIGDEAVVLRDGSVVNHARMKDVDMAWMVTNMVGRAQDELHVPVTATPGETILTIDNLIVADPQNPGRTAVRDFSLDVRKGEVIGIYGLMGSGRTELLETIIGRNKAQGGAIGFAGQDITKMSIAQRIARGIYLVPEDRQRDGLVQGQTVGFNLSLASILGFLKGPFVSRRREKARTAEIIRNTRVKASSAKALIGSLSGGNQQKVVIGKALMTDPRLVLLDEPTRGIDIGAKADIFRFMADLADQGIAVIFTTSDVSEVLTSCSRVLVVSRGRITAEFAPEDVTRERVLAAADDSHQTLDSIDSQTTSHTQDGTQK